MSRHDQKSNWQKIVERFTLINQSISLLPSHFQIHSIVPWDTTATAIKIFTAIQNPRKNTTQNSNKAITRSQLNSLHPSRSRSYHYCVYFVTNVEQKSTGNEHFQGKMKRTERKLLFEIRLWLLKMKSLC